ncbi:hypothetical protein ACKKBF_B39865 [Auxenochlorella protothecoides x Auxenochlorella symbiontica]
MFLGEASSSTKSGSLFVGDSTPPSSPSEGRLRLVINSSRKAWNPICRHLGRGGIYLIPSSQDNNWAPRSKLQAGAAALATVVSSGSP